MQHFLVGQHGRFHRTAGMHVFAGRCRDQRGQPHDIAIAEFAQGGGLIALSGEKPSLALQDQQHLVGQHAIRRKRLAWPEHPVAGWIAF